MKTKPKTAQKRNRATRGAKGDAAGRRDSRQVRTGVRAGLTGLQPVGFQPPGAGGKVSMEGGEF